MQTSEFAAELNHPLQSQRPNLNQMSVVKVDHCGFMSGLVSRQSKNVLLFLTDVFKLVSPPHPRPLLICPGSFNLRWIALCRGGLFSR